MSTMGLDDASSFNHEEAILFQRLSTMLPHLSAETDHKIGQPYHHPQLVNIFPTPVHPSRGLNRLRLKTTITNVRKAHTIPFITRQTTRIITPLMMVVPCLTPPAQTTHRNLRRLFTTHLLQHTTLSLLRPTRLLRTRPNRPLPPLFRQHRLTQLLQRRSPTRKLWSLEEVGDRVARHQYPYLSLCSPLGLPMMPGKGYRARVDRKGRINLMCRLALHTEDVELFFVWIFVNAGEQQRMEQMTAAADEEHCQPVWSCAGNQRRM